MDAVKQMQEDEENKHTPVGCGIIKALIDHEMGHQIKDLLDGTHDGEIKKLFNKYHVKDDDVKMGKVLSRYANTNISEFISEAWSEYMNNPNPRPVAEKVGKRLIELYKEKFSK